MPTILDFQIQPLSAESYSLTVCERGSAQPLATATFSHRVDFLTDFSVDRLNASTKDAAERFDELQKLGRELYQKLFLPAVAQVWREYKQRSEFLILCLRFAEGAAKLEVLPWETLHDGAEFIAAGAKTTLTRLPLDIAPPSELPLIPRPLKLFGFFASPLDLLDHERLKAEREQEILLEAINDPAGQGRISADFEDEAKLEILERSLKDGYHILHFTGHGISPREDGGLLLEDAHGKKLPASVAEVMQTIESGVDKLRLAVISGCQTARTLHTHGFNDLARALLRQRVPAVIAMQFSITDDGGLKFAEVLYREIAKGARLERAVHTARRVLLEYNTGRRTDFDVNSDALAIVLLAADGACLQTAEAESLPPQAEVNATYLGDRLDPLAHGFYGRRREYRKIRDALLHQDQRAAIIHGIGGIGKTALLTHAINRLRPRFKDVMSFDCRRAALAPETILLELHRYFAAQGKPQLQSLIGQNVPPETLADEIAKLLTEWPLLIVFDNFETQLDERRKFINKDLRVFLTTLVRATTLGSRFLFTTRYLFDLDGERLGNVQELPLGDLSRAEALMLMQKLPNLAKAGVRHKDAAMKKFGRHPKAMVMLNDYCSHQPLDQALQDASSLKSELREFLAIELNYRRLSERARELLNRLAAFRIGVPFEAAEWVIGERASPAEEFLEANWDYLPDELKAMDKETLLQTLNETLKEEALLQTVNEWQPEVRRADKVGDYVYELIDWSLLTPQLEGSQLQSIAVHSLVRDFCRDQQLPETWRERLRTAAKFLTNWTRLIEQDDKSPDVVWKEIEAFELLMEAEDFENATKLLLNAHKLLVRWGFSRFVKEQYQRLSNKVDKRALAATLRGQATILKDRGDYVTALEHYQWSLVISEELSDRTGIAKSLGQIGIIHHMRGEYEAALGHYHRSLTIFEELGDHTGIAISLHHIGVIHQYRGDYGVALEHYRRSQTILEEVGDQVGVAKSLGQSATIHHMRGEYEAALKHYQRSLIIFEKLGDRESAAISRHQMGMILQARGKDSAALEQYQRSLMIAEELEDREGMMSSLHQIGGIYQDSGEYRAALENYQRSLIIAEELGDRAGMATSHGRIGNLFIKMGQYEEAFSMLLSALATFLKLQSPNVTNAVNDLRRLWTAWGATNFNAAWREATEEDVPEWLTGESEGKAS